METITQHTHLDAMSTPDHSQYLKMEDLHTTDSTSPAPSTSDAAYSQSSPPPVVVHSRPAKKRKSWGQELPEPKTTLPPRKRAKTDDEKEQRRIERIKRNRAAAHNSRERKRQEAEYLAVALAKANAELEAYRKLHGPLPSDIVLPEVRLCTESADTVATPAPSLVESHGSHGDAPSPASPTDDIFHQPAIKQEPLESSFQSNLPPVFETTDEKSSVLLPLDLTQHSAVSVQPQEQQHDFSSFLVGQSHPLFGELPSSDMLSHSHGSSLDAFAFADGAFDASIGPSLNFSFDDLIDDQATFAVDAQTSGAA